MKRHIISIFGLLAACTALFAQTGEPFIAPDSLETAPEGYRIVDTVLYTPVSRLNGELAGKDIFSLIPEEDVTIHQSGAVEDALRMRIEENSGTLTDGYRIRIYFDNRQDAREASAESEARFKSLFPGYNTYRTFQNPFFKVTVGDFRTKTDAVKALQAVIKAFPSAFVVKEKMRFPVISENVRVQVDTVRMLVPIETETPLQADNNVGQ